MRNFQLISSILSRPWAIDQEWVQNNLSAVHQLLTGGDFSGIAIGQNPKPNALQVLSPGDFGFKPEYVSTFSNAAQGSIAIIPIIGPIIKYNGDCGEVGSETMERWVRDAANSRSIIGAIFRIDSPGGMVDGTSNLADTIKAFGKPTIALVNDGMMASAALWIGSATDHILATQPLDTIGSIGVFTTLMDVRGWFEGMGVKIHEIYSRLSADKNLDYRQALEGKYDAVKDRLDVIAQQFISTVKINRGDRLKADTPGLLTGKMFYAQDAIEAGLIDGFGNMDDAVDMILEMAEAQNVASSASTNNYQATNHSSMFGNKYTKLSALKGKTPEQVTSQDLDAANEELQANGITAVGLITSTEAEQAESAVAENTRINSELTQAKTDLATAKGDLEKANEKAKTAEESASEWKGKYEKLANEDAAEEASLKGDGEKSEEQDGFKATPLSELMD